MPKPAPLETVDLLGVDLLAADVRVFGHNSAPGGDVYDVERLQAVADASNAVVNEAKPFVKIGHSIEQRLARESGLYDDAGEQPATGWMRNFRVEGDKLKGDLLAVPKKLADLVPTAFRTRSTEVSAFQSQETGEKYPVVVRGVALLGAKAPAFRTLDDIHALYAGEDRESLAAVLYADEALDDPAVTAIDYGEGDVVWDPELTANGLMADIRELLNPGPPGEMASRYWVQDVMMTPSGGKALVCDGSDSDAYWVIPFTIGADHEPVLAASSEWVMAQQAWIQTRPDADDQPPKPAAATATPTEYDDSGKPADTSRTMPIINLTEAQVTEFAEALGVAADTELTPEALIEAAKAKPVVEPVKPVDAPVVIPDGMKLMSEADITELKTYGAAGREALTRLDAMTRDAAITKALTEGKIDPAKKDEWVTRYEEQPVFTQSILDGLEPQEKYKTYGADGEGTIDADVAAMNEAQYAEFCALTGIPYDPEKKPEEKVAA